VSDAITVFEVLASTLTFIIGAISVLMVLIGGLRYIISEGDQNSVTAAKNTILYAIVGLVVAMLSYAVVNFVLWRLSSSDRSTPKPDESRLEMASWMPITAFGFAACSVLIAVLVLLRRSSRGLRWIARYSAFWMPPDERARRMGERWGLLRDTDFALRLWFTLTLVVASPITGWRCRRSRRKETFEVRAELESFA
jgi:Type IV secretion system pilin